jgi:hypothetical protein
MAHTGGLLLAEWSLFALFNETAAAGAGVDDDESADMVDEEVNV